jgi:uncharacterized protein YneR
VYKVDGGKSKEKNTFGAGQKIEKFAERNYTKIESIRFQIEEQDLLFNIYLFKFEVCIQPLFSNLIYEKQLL